MTITRLKEDLKALSNETGYAASLLPVPHEAGETMEELNENLSDAITGWLSVSLTGDLAR